jgi:glycerophosphoryl diester phosphodiesterase
MNNPWLTRRPLHYAHQGGALEAPSTTLYAMRRAVQQFGAHALELDVHRTIDGHLVVTHDETVDRTTPRTGSIHSLTLAELRSLDNAYWWVPGFESTTDQPPEAYVFRGRFPEDPSFGIPTIEEVLNEFGDTFLNFDIKETRPHRYEAQLADTLRAYGRTDDVIVASFHDDALRAFSAYAPEIHVALGPTDTFAFYAAVTSEATMPTFASSQVALQIPSTFEGIEVINEPFVTAAHQVGLAVHAWTIDDPLEMHQLLDWGVDGIMTDTPSVCASVLNERDS